MSLPLDERSFNDMYYPEVCFSSFVRSLGEWWTAKHQPDSENEARQRYGTLLGFIGLILLTFRSLAESDRRRSEADSSLAGSTRLQGDAYEDDELVHGGCELCHALVESSSVRCVIEVLYDTGENFSVKQSKNVSGNSREWRSVIDFTSLRFYRHGSTSIICSCPNEAIFGAEYALKLIIFPFLRFRSIGEATKAYAKKYNPRDEETDQSSNAQHVVGVLASSDSWILMPFIKGLTLSEFMATPGLVKAKLKNPDMTISDVLRTSLSGVDEQVLQDKTALTRQRLRYLTIDELMQAEAVVHSLRANHEHRNRAIEAVIRKMEIFPMTANLARIISDRRRSEAAESVSLESMLTMGTSLFRAMEDLRAIGHEWSSDEIENSSPTPSSVHGDLTPSNIIVDDSANISFTLIDLGRNYFYTLSMTGYGGTDSIFVAPEVRKDVRSIRVADVYSIGQLLQYIATGGILPAQIVVDGLYQTIPLIARFVEDMIQENPRYRLSIFRAPDMLDGIDYEVFGNLFREEVKAVISASEYGHAYGTGGFVDTLRDIATPTDGAVRRQFDLWRARRAVDKVRDAEVRTYTTALFGWSALSALVGAIVGLTVVMWFLRDAQWTWSGHIVEIWSRLTGGKGSNFPGLDRVRAADYHVPDLSANWPARLVGISYVLVGTKFYQNIFAGQMPLLGRRPGLPGRRALRAEIFMRTITLTSGVLVILITLYEARFWPIASAIGQTIIAFANLAIFRFAVKSIDEAREEGISTAGERGSRLAGLISFGEWVPAAFFWAAIVWFIGSLIYLGVLHDVGAYAVGVASTNLFLFYVVKCGGESGRDIRIALSRACNAAERVRIMNPSEVLPVGSCRRGSRKVRLPLHALRRLRGRQGRGKVG